MGERWENDGKLQGVELTAGDVMFMIGQDDWKKGRDRVKGEGMRLYCTTDQDIDHLAVMAAARQRSGRASTEVPAEPPSYASPLVFTGRGTSTHNERRITLADLPPPISTLIPTLPPTIRTYVTR